MSAASPLPCAMPARRVAHLSFPPWPNRPPLARTDPGSRPDTASSLRSRRPWYQSPTWCWAALRGRLTRTLRLCRQAYLLHQPHHPLARAMHPTSFEHRMNAWAARDLLMVLFAPSSRQLPALGSSKPAPRSREEVLHVPPEHPGALLLLSAPHL